MTSFTKLKSVFYTAIAVGLVAQLFVSWWLIFHDAALMADWPLPLLVVQMLLSGTANLILALVFVILAKNVDAKKIDTVNSGYQPSKGTLRNPPGDE